MRISSFTIKNYRSISEVNAHSLFDHTITCFIGKNGSGKSNILRALASIKDDTYITDDDAFEGDVTGEPITISADITLNGSVPLSEIGLQDGSINSIRVIKSKKIGEAPITRVTPLDYTYDASRDFDTSVKNFKKVIAQKIGDPEKTSLNDLAEQLRTSDDRSSAFIALETKHNEIGLPPSGEIKDALEEIRFQVDNPVELRYCAILDSLDIVLLADFDTYRVENSAKLSEISDRSKNPFIHDLLKLSGKTVAEFSDSHGHKRINTSESASRKINTELNRVWKARGLEIILQKDHNDELLSVCFRTPQGKAVPLRNLSDGEQWFLRFYTRLANVKGNSKNTIWLFDEPGKDLHVSSQDDMKKFFEEQAQESQVLYTTHQPFLSQWHRLERTYVVMNAKTEDNNKLGVGTVIEKRFWKDDGIHPPLREALSLFLGEDTLTGKKQIIVEGVSDYFYLLGWMRSLSDSKQSSSITKYLSEDSTIIPVQGKATIPLYLLFLTKSTKKGVDWVVLIDSHSETEELKNRLTSTSIETYFAKCSLNVEDTFSGDKSRKFLDIEDLFDPDEYIKEAEEYYRENHPDIKLPRKFKPSLEGNITKQYWDAIKGLNKKRDFQSEGISLDKTGIAQSIFLKLVFGEDIFSKSTSARFKKLSEQLIKLF